MDSRTQKDYETKISRLERDIHNLKAEIDRKEERNRELREESCELYAKLDEIKNFARQIEDECYV